MIDDVEDFYDGVFDMEGCYCILSEIEQKTYECHEKYTNKTASFDEVCYLYEHGIITLDHIDEYYRKCRSHKQERPLAYYGA